MPPKEKDEPTTSNLVAIHLAAVEKRDKTHGTRLETLAKHAALTTGLQKAITEETDARAAAMLDGQKLDPKHVSKVADFREQLANQSALIGAIHRRHCDAVSVEKTARLELNREKRGALSAKVRKHDEHVEELRRELELASTVREPLARELFELDEAIAIDGAPIEPTILSGPIDEVLSEARAPQSTVDLVELAKIEAGWKTLSPGSHPMAASYGPAAECVLAFWPDNGQIVTAEVLTYGAPGGRLVENPALGVEYRKYHGFAPLKQRMIADRFGATTAA